MTKTEERVRAVLEPMAIMERHGFEMSVEIELAVRLTTILVNDVIREQQEYAASVQRGKSSFD